MRLADRIILNTISNYALTFVTMITNLVMVPVVIRQLGASGYGLAIMVLVPFGIFDAFAGMFTRAMHRFIPQDQASGDEERVSRTFTTAMAGFVLMGVVGAIIVWRLSNWFLQDADITAAVMADGRRAMWIMIGWLVVGFPSWCYRKGLEAIQRYDLIGYSHGLITVARTVLVIIVFSRKQGSVTLFVASHLAAITISSLLCRWTMRRANPAMCVRPKLINRTSLALMGSFASATLVGIAGEVCGSYGFRIVLGKLLGMEAFGAFSAVSQVQQTLCRLIDELTNAFSPAISALDASGASSMVAKLMLTGTKSSMMAASAMSVVPLAAATSFLHLWLGEKFFQYDALFVMLLLLTLLYCVGLTPMYVLFGLGKVEATGRTLFIRGLAGLLVSFAYVKWMHGGLMGAVACMFGVQYGGSLWMLVLACRAVGVSGRLALWEVIVRPLALASVGGLATWGLLHVFGDNKYWKLGAAVSGGEVVLVVLILVAGLGEEERARILSFFTRAWAKLVGAARPVGG